MKLSLLFNLALCFSLLEAQTCTDKFLRLRQTVPLDDILAMKTALFTFGDHRTVRCAFVALDNSASFLVLTLIETGSLSYQQSTSALKSCSLNKGCSFNEQDVSVGESQSLYRWSKSNIVEYRNLTIQESESATAYLLLTCNQDLNMDRDFMLLPFHDDFLTTVFSRGCYQIAQANIRGYNCVDSVGNFWNNANDHFHFQSNSCFCGGCCGWYAGSVVSEDNFGAYTTGTSTNPSFSCSATLTSTTDYWIASMVNNETTLSPSLDPTTEPTSEPTEEPTTNPSSAPSGAAAPPPGDDVDDNYGLNITVKFQDQLSHNATKEITLVVRAYVLQKSLITRNCSELIDDSFYIEEEKTVIEVVVVTCSELAEDQLFAAINATALETSIDNVTEAEADITITRRKPPRISVPNNQDVWRLLEEYYWLVIIGALLCLLPLCCAAYRKCMLRFCRVQHEDNHAPSPSKPEDDHVELQAKQSLKPKGNTDVDERMYIRNALVLLIGISDYQFKDNLPGVAVDMDSYRELWRDKYNYDVLPTKDDVRWLNKEQWTFEDVEEFVSQKRKKLLDDDDTLLYDALIVMINGHGNGRGIITSEWEPILSGDDAATKKRKQVNNVELGISGLQGLVSPSFDRKMRKIPRIFVVDACRGGVGSGSFDLSRDRNGSSIHEASLVCTVYGNSPGIIVKEHATNGGYFSQCFRRQLGKTVHADATLSDLTKQAGKALKEMTHNAQMCWLDGDPQCHDIVFMKKSIVEHAL